MKKEQLKEDFFKYLTEEPSPGKEKITRLAAEELNAASLAPPPALWSKIQKKISEQRAIEDVGFGAKLKSLFSPPLMPALALGAIGVLVGAFLLLSQGSPPKELPLVELTKAIPKQKGDVFMAKGMRIENLGGGTIARIAGNTDKIILSSGSWQMALEHKALEKPVQFIFPGGALEPIGTAFTVTIGKDGTAVNLVEGKIRLYEHDPADAKKWKMSELAAPYNGTLKPAAVETEIKIETDVVEKKKEIPSKYANYVGKDITVELKNGDRLSGKLRTAKDGVLSIANASGNLRIRERDVVSISRN
jgi:hypothetical protein